MSSSVIVAIGYDEGAETLDVEFVSGAVCRYYGVDPDVYEDFRSAASKGRFFNRHIKDAYPWEKVVR
ncbi:MAG: KTSC domain-containing protein [Microvirga sp.]